jgi:hypothetical protein
MLWGCFSWLCWLIWLKMERVSHELMASKMSKKLGRLVAENMKENETVLERNHG